MTLLLSYAITNALRFQGLHAMHAASIGSFWCNSVWYVSVTSPNGDDVTLQMRNQIRLPPEIASSGCGGRIADVTVVEILFQIVVNLIQVPATSNVL
jgi:hypothetical protein